MTRQEGIEARMCLQRQELSLTLAGKLAIEHAQRVKHKEVDKEILKQYEPGYVPDLQIPERKKTDEEIEMEQILKNYM